jgi:hypothetical protein
MGLRLTLERVISFTEGHLWSLRIEKRRETKSGREGTPNRIVTLLGHKGDSPADLLRLMADLYDAGEVPLDPADLDKASKEVQENLRTILGRLQTP